MKHADNANSALLHYLDSLLNDETVEVNEQCKDTSVSVTDPSKESSKCEAKISEKNPNEIGLQLLSVADIPLAIPLGVISSIIDIKQAILLSTGEINEVSIRTYDHLGNKIDVISLHDIIFPNNHPARQNYVIGNDSKILIINESNFGILCDQIDKSIYINRDEIAWRAKRTSRRWLAGMWQGMNSVILDVNEIINMAKPDANIIH